MCIISTCKTVKFILTSSICNFSSLLNGYSAPRKGIESDKVRSALSDDVYEFSILFFQYIFMSDCFERILEESKWADAGE
jgi:hypothetical protein